MNEEVEERVYRQMKDAANCGVLEPLPGVIYPDKRRLKAYVESGELQDTSLPEALSEAFRTHAERVALFTAEGRVTYAELDAITDRCAAAFLRLGLRPLDRVLFQIANCKELLFSFIGCLKAGLIPVCTLPAHREREIEYLGRHVDAQAHIVQGDDPKFDLPAFAQTMRARIPTIRHVISVRGATVAGIDRLEELIKSIQPVAASRMVQELPRDSFQVGLFQLSGGTTDVPKVIPRMHNDYLLNATLTANWLGFSSDDVMFMPMPMIHNACMICFWLPTLLTGAAFVIAADMTPESWGGAISNAKPSWIGLIRALLPRLDTVIDRKWASLDSVRAFWCPDAARMVRERFGRPTFAMFGMSEGLNMYTRASDPPEVLDWTVGRPLSRFDEVRLIQPGTEVEVGLGEIGELTCRGPYTLSGYYNAPERNREAFTSQGFYRTGDLMVCSEFAGERVYAFAGRTRDVISRGHEKVNCEEVENAVSSHPAISGCAVVGMPDPVLGDRVCVYVVVKHGCAPPGLDELAQHMKILGFAKFKWPERVEVIDALPLSKVGKLDKAPLRVLIRQKMTEPGGVRIGIPDTSSKKGQHR
jgi:2,3-dihydroxybenzoate-AMP ligase